ncbi:MAG: hydroxymethylglutaryl-CoA lyase [Gammaproteobacteria bacterium]|nr:hydroxymethylglutaryl-CoA lyase [Gammaproteobacteria bacterium]
MSQIDILISEVGPRDGLQSIESIMSTQDKKNWIQAEAKAGVREIEVGSFVPAKLLPQMADTADLVRYAKTIPNLTVAALVPNFIGAKNAIDAGVDKMCLPLSVSETHSKANLKKNHSQVLEEVKIISQYIKTLDENDRPEFEGNLSTAFGCTLEGKVSEKAVLSLGVKMMELGCNEVGLSDTTGYANPAQIKRLIRLLKKEVGNENLTSVHLHNTRGLGLANALAALDEGITTLDSSLGGIGGCPFAPGASGNIVTEDLVFMLEAMGINTGIDIEALLAVNQMVKKALPNEELYGFTIDSGLPKGYADGGWGLTD